MTCPRCGAALPADAPEGLCASCLLTAGTETITYATGEATIASGNSGGFQLSGARLEPGQLWGPYHIGRLLGRGGMGEVYEAEHVESGRRVAVKILRGLLRDAEDRARFIREGQLAASISHPHTVYVFGSEEIGGLPVISMELLPGGTLKERVRTSGPLAPADAAEAILEVIGGLDAAQAVGILHRDVKPSNCFVDIDGSIKVGDFGLSISTLARDVHHELGIGVFQGTPQFAAPEQLRGEPLDLRADIYAVGATLFYLLTGRPPFDGRDLQTLVAKVTSEPPPSPRRLRPGVPSGLAAVVTQCLAKSPTGRPATYGALADLLRPFARHEDMPAGLGARFMAGVIDALIVSLASGLWVAARIAVTGAAVAPSAWGWFVNAVYYLFFEGVWGASPGKRLLGLTVTSQGQPASWGQIAARTVVFFTPPLLIALVMTEPNLVLAGGSGGGQLTLDRGGVTALIGLTLFVTARLRNGRAALHDLLSGTRVVKRSHRAYRRAPVAHDAVVTAPPTSVPPSAVRYGPYLALADAGVTEGGRLIVAFDPLLRRRVWLHVVAPGTPPIQAARRDVRRAGRLHWLTGRRAPSENWDAYEAPDGRPLLSQPGESDRTSGPGQNTSWAIGKHWLLDLAAELSAGARDGSLPRLGLDRLWLRSDGRLIVLDFPAPSPMPSLHVPPVLVTPVELLAAVAAYMTGDSAVIQPPDRMPLGARSFLARLSSDTPPSIDEAHRMLADVAARPDRVSSAWRSVPMALAAAPIVLMLLVGVVTVPLFLSILSPQTGEMLAWLDRLHRPPAADSRLSDPVVRDAAERYLVGRWGSTLDTESFWSAITMQGNLADMRRTWEAIAARHPTVSPADFQGASTILAPEIERSRQNWGNRSPGFDDGGDIILMALVMLAAACVVASSLVSAIAVPGGIAMHLLGLSTVTREGVPIGRLHSLGRAVIAWLPAIAWLAYLASVPRVQGWVPRPPSPMLGTTLVLVAMGACATWTILHPTRGPHDRLAGTWVVPR